MQQGNDVVGRQTLMEIYLDEMSDLIASRDRGTISGYNA
jgi:hypothetical protein